MIVQELINWLLKQPSTAIVCVYADHGQSTMKATTTTLAKVHTEDLKESQMDTIHPNDEDDEEDYTEVVEIGAP